MRHWKVKNQRAPHSHKQDVQGKSHTCVKFRDTLNLNTSGSNGLKSLGNECTAGSCWHVNTQYLRSATLRKHLLQS